MMEDISNWKVGHPNEEFGENVTNRVGKAMQGNSQ